MHAISAFGAATYRVRRKNLDYCLRIDGTDMAEPSYHHGAKAGHEFRKVVSWFSNEPLKEDLPRDWVYNQISQSLLVSQSHAAGIVNTSSSWPSRSLDFRVEDAVM